MNKCCCGEPVAGAGPSKRKCPISRPSSRLCRVPEKTTATAWRVLAARRLSFPGVETRPIVEVDSGEGHPETKTDSSPPLALVDVVRAGCPVIQGTSPWPTAPGPLPSFDPGSAADDSKDRSGSTEFPGHTTEPPGGGGVLPFCQDFLFAFAVSSVKTRPTY